MTDQPGITVTRLGETCGEPCDHCYGDSVGPCLLPAEHEGHHTCEAPW